MSRFALARLGAVLAFGAPTLMMMPALSGGVESSSDALRMWSGLTLRLADGPLAPLSALVVQAASWLPLGPLSWRVGLAFLGLAGLSSALLFVTGSRLARIAGVRSDVFAALVGVGVAWLTLGSPVLLAVAVGGDRQTLALFLFCAVMERVTFALQTNAGSNHDCEPNANLGISALSGAAFVLGLLFVESPLWGVLALPGLIVVWRTPAFHTVVKQRRRWVMMGALGLAPSVYGLLRWVPDTGYGPGVSLPFSESAQALDSGLRTLIVWLCLGAFAVSGWTAWRLATWPPWAPFLAWWLAAALVVFVEGLPGQIRLHALSMLVLASAPLLVLPIVRLVQGKAGQASALGWVCVVGLCAVGMAQMNRFTRERESRPRLREDLLAEGTVARLPVGGVALLSSVQINALLLAARVAEGLRPDLVLVDRGRLGNHGYLPSVLGRTPALRSVLSTTLLDGTLSLPHLQTLAGAHGVALELLEKDVPTLFDGLRPSGLLYEVLAGGATGDDVQSAGARRAALFAELYRDMPENSLMPDTGQWLGQHHRVNALHAMAMGKHELAREALNYGARLQPADPRFSEMQVYLADRADSTRLPIEPLISPELRAP